MTAQTFRELLSQHPFQPFRLIMLEGPSYEVRHPEMAFLTQTCIVVGLDFGEDDMPNEFKICSLVNVGGVERLDLDLNRAG